MQVENCPYNFPVDAHFPGRRKLAGLEGGVVWLAEKDDRYYLISDEGSMADFLIPGEDDDLLGQMVKVYAFESEAERNQFIQQRGWKSHSG